MENRRVQDENTEKLWKAVNELDRKVSNGITDRGIRTDENVKELVRKHELFTKEFTQHLLKEEVEAHEMKLELQRQTAALDAVFSSITALAKTQEGFVKAKNRGMLLIIGGLTATIGFILTYLPEISKFVNHIATDIHLS
jgi:ADP-ribosylglycohydrolase